MFRLRILLMACACTCGLMLPDRCVAGAPSWNEIHSQHFVVLTDGADKYAREVALRFEQMRATFGSLLEKRRLGMPVPLSIVALKNEADYWRVAPASRGAGAVAQGGFLLWGEDRVFIVLNLSVEAPWRAVAYDYARLLLYFNYPITQPWFDEGLTEYFSSVRVSDKQTELGEVPAVADSNSPNFASLLSRPDWIPLPTLFAAEASGASCPAARRSTQFCAQSWLLMHYLIDKQLLPQAGTYFDLVHNQNVPIDQAIAKAFEMPPEQMQPKLQDFFHSLSGNPSPGANPSAAKPVGFAAGSPTLVGADDIAMNLTQVPDAEARARLAEIAVRDSSHRAQASADLEKMAQGEPESEIAHRGLAWLHIENQEWEPAANDLQRAAELDAHDHWIRYYLPLMKYRKAQSSGQEVQGLANMIQDLKAVLDWYPEFAEAYNMLAMGRMEGGGNASALEAMRAAIQLSPRNQQYVYNLGTIYLAGKKFDAARALFTPLSSSPDAKVAEAARRQLADVSVIQKYGVPPAKPAAPKTEDKVQSAKNGTEVSRDSDEKQEDESEAEAGRLKGPILFLKGKLLSVDCSQAPTATMSVSSGGKTVTLRTRDYKSLLVIGADNFSCNWKGRAVSVNYRASSKGPAELVSIEVQ
jgi:Flp pilus assembly protein TadD